MFVSPARVSHMYYAEGLTQAQIASQLGVSRIKVSRMIQQARADGTVDIRIRYSGFYPDLEKAVSAAWPGTRFVVTDPLDGSDDQTKVSMGAAAAELLPSLLPEGGRLAVGWGSTLRVVADQVNEPMPNVTVVPLLGGQVHAGLDVHANTIADRIASRTGASAQRLFAPAVASSVAEKHVLIASEQVTRAQGAAAAADVALLSVGSPFSASSTLEQVGYYTAADIEALREARAACDVVSIVYFDEDGERCCRELSDRTVSITEEQLRAIPVKVCVAGGESKHQAIRIALQEGFIDVLVTDADTARVLSR
ncbi:sugar-binding transcriptional regulator [Propionibacteriaceae bacterium Y1923]